MSTTDTSTRTWTAVRAEIARTIKADPGADVTELRRELRAAKLADTIERTVAGWPPLTARQRSVLAQLLRPVATSGEKASNE